MATIRKRNGSYQIRVSGGYDTNGKQIVHQKTWKPDKAMTARQEEKELQRVVVLFEEQCAKGEFLDGSIKFADFAAIWMKEHAEKQLRETTIFNYGKMLPTINAIIGHVRLDRLQPRHLIECYNKLQEQGKKDNSRYKPIFDFAEYLKSESVSMSELSRRAGVSLSTVQTVCRGGTISAQTAEKLAAAVGRKDAFFCVESDRTISGKTLSNYHRLISSILETAVKWQIILSNPCSRVQAPKIERKEARYLDESQALEILSKLDGEPLKFRALVTLLLYSGMRRGEICGLTWADVDMNTGVIDINKSSLYLPGKGVFDDKTKNVTSTRSIKVPTFVINLLRTLRVEQEQNRSDHGTAWQGAPGNLCKVFTQIDGKPLHPCTVTNWFNDFIKRNNLPSASVHSLRHTNASLLIASGVDLRTVSKRLGHAQMSTTANIYTHAIRTADERAADALDDILTPSKRA